MGVEGNRCKALTLQVLLCSILEVLFTFIPVVQATTKRMV